MNSPQNASFTFKAILVLIAAVIVLMISQSVNEQVVLNEESASRDRNDAAVLHGYIGSMGGFVRSALGRDQARHLRHDSFLSGNA